MKRLLFLVFLVPAFLQAEWDNLFYEEDPTLFHHVNVITGTFNVCMQDTVVKGAQSIPIFRTYCTTIDNTKESEESLRAMHEGFFFRGGWSLFPQVNMYVKYYPKTHPEIRRAQDMKVFIPESSGSMIAYSFDRIEFMNGKNGTKFHVFTPEQKNGQFSGKISARSNPENNLLSIDCRRGKATLSLADNGMREYKEITRRKNVTNSCSSSYYHLIRERMPSGHILLYTYDKKGKLKKIHCKDAQEEHILSCLILSYDSDDIDPFRIEVRTSDQKVFQYVGGKHKRKEYLMRVRRQNEPLTRENWEYERGKQKQISRVKSLNLSGREQMQLTYYPFDRAKTKKGEEYWSRNDNTDKVEMIEAPIGVDGAMEPIANFDYQKNFTEVKDAEGVYTRYHHEDDRLTEIEYLDTEKEKHLTETFLWGEGRLIAKIQKDPEGKAYFSKTMEYDEVGNVTKETLWGNFSGLLTPPFEIGEKGDLIGAESHSKVYTYNSSKWLPRTEQEEGGPLIKYRYKPGSNLLIRKFVTAHDEIQSRTFNFYSEGNHLIKEITDDGTSRYSRDLTNVTRRLIKTYDLKTNGMPHTISESYLDLETGREILIQKTELLYSQSKNVIEEKIYDSEEVLTYTINSEYDHLGRVVRKITSLGQESTYSYTPYGELKEVKEPGSPKKTYTYDTFGRPLSCTSLEKTIYTTYDSKGRLLEKTDENGNVTRQTYDCFGHCLETRFPDTLDENQEEYTPTLAFGYDPQGNLMTSTNPKGVQTRTEYNVLRKPTLEIQPDGSELRHVYNTNSSVAETHYSNGTKIFHTYDIFGRLLTKTTLSSDEDILGEESWEYDSFNLLSYTDSRGLTTHYTYDGAGRKIAEEALGRKITYEYDTKGNLEKTIQGGITRVQIHDAGGRVIKEFEKDRFQHQKNITSYTYDSENRKIKTERETSQGAVFDYFEYDEQGRLISHTDPLGAVTRFIYEDAYLNVQAQKVLRKTTIDPIGNRTIEEFDVAGRLVLLEKQNPQEETVSSQRHAFDRAGNQVLREITVYIDNEAQNTHTTSFEYDTAGRLIKEIEQEEKVTEFRYDIHGRLVEKILQSNETLSYTYDALDRMTSLQSSDGSVHDSFRYQGPDLLEAYDHIHNVRVLRTYNPFGQILSEVDANDHPYRWEYDDLGRCIRFTLPDQTSIAYSYRGLYLSTVSRPNYKHSYILYDVNGHVIHENLILKLGVQSTKHDKLERPLSQCNPYINQHITYGPSGLVTSTKNDRLQDKNYTYDPLNQLKQEGNQTYHFDSIGNPTNYQVNALNQITATPDTNFTYDPNGNLTHRLDSTEETSYTFDLLGRLTSMTTNDEKVHFQYDPFSRLISQTTPTETTHYLYDQEREIGAITPSGEIFELKVLGLGIKGDLGAAVALEIKDKVYAPIHDFSGNITALIAPDKTLIETYQYTAFGQEEKSGEISPWGFCSKRSIKGLVYFGMRFYDPSLGRWLTPDPAGDVDSANLYLYVLNSPLNRLDLFGLSSEDYYVPPPPQAYYGIPSDNSSLRIPTYPRARLSNYSISREPLHLKWFSGGTSTDVYVSSGHFHKLQFSAEERNVGYANLHDHFSEIIPKEGSQIGIIFLTNGINTTFDGFRNNVQSVINMTPEGTTIVGLYNKTEGIGGDLSRCNKEVRGYDTPVVIAHRQLLETSLSALASVNPKALALKLAHSEGSLIGRCAIEGMSDKGKALVKKHVLVTTVGAANPIPLDYVLGCTNYYSDRDHFARYAKGYSRAMENFIVRGRQVPKNLTYDIRYVKSMLDPKDQSGPDHDFLGETYQSVLENRFILLRKDYGFYGQSR
ncbi:MAG: tRNA(Glu)-specific nuclease WapA [Chlamydiae bacterium]|nr:tRNA(Glu)-specific nuclease WapA [Chlamydiota bacterium]